MGRPRTDVKSPVAPPYAPSPTCLISCRASCDPDPQQTPSSRLADLVSNLVGNLMVVTTKDGTRFDGVLVSLTHGTDTPPSITLQLARKVSTTETRAVASLSFALADIVSATATSVNLSDTASTANVSDFQTDADISRAAGMGRERELRPWRPDSDGYDEHLEHRTDERKQWDQFAANEKLFGIRTSFDENEYTIPLDRESSDYKRRETEVERLASEIAQVPLHARTASCRRPRETRTWPRSVGCSSTTACLMRRTGTAP